MKSLLLFSFLFLFSSITSGMDQVEILNKWSGKTRNEEHIDAGPQNGVLTDANEFSELWKKWMPDEKLPEVDFKNEVILVATVRGPNQMIVGEQLEVKDGDVTFRPGATRMGGPGFGFMFAKVAREGVKSVNGVPVPEAGPVGDYVKVEMVGSVQTGIMAIGGESTGVMMTSGNIRWELELTPEQHQAAEALGDAKAKVTGHLTLNQGVEIQKRWIVKVDKIEAAKD